MTAQESPVLEILRERVQCRFPILFLSTFEEERWESELATLALDMERGLVVWTATDGASPPLESAADGHMDPATFLEQIRSYPRDHVFLLKDFHPWLSEPIVVRRMRDLVPHLTEQDKTILIMSPEVEVPLELARDSVSIELPLPGLEEMREELRDVLVQRQHSGEPHITVSGAQEERLLKTLLGLTSKQAGQALTRALLGRGTLDDDVYRLLISEKKHMVQGSELLEFQDIAEGAKDIGGLEGLKDWVAKRSEAFSEKARMQGIPSPKGVLLLGVQGCGKSLTSRAIAQMMSFPLVRLDVSTLLSADRGGSEKNLRDVLNLMEMISPAVLWMDEVEKGFAGSGEGSGDSTMVRLMGRFLTWMQEKPAPVFVVATANSVTGLPPEMLRRGRFDELFFVDLPNYHERKQIFEIHLKKRGLDPAEFDVNAFSEKTEGYSGAEIEQAVLAAVVESFTRGGGVTQKEIEDSIEDTVPLSVTMEEKIFELREWARTRCRPATPDSRVLQMLEEEHREKTGEESSEVLNLFDQDDFDDDEEEQELNWKTMIADGQIRAGLMEFIAERETVTFDVLKSELSECMPSDGEFGLALRSDPKVLLWLGLSADVAAPLSKLVSDRKVYLHPAVESDYSNGFPRSSVPTLPELPDSRVSRPCWLPVTLSVGQPDEIDERLTRIARMRLNK